MYLIHHLALKRRGGYEGYWYTGPIYLTPYKTYGEMLQVKGGLHVYLIHHVRDFVRWCACKRCGGHCVNIFNPIQNIGRTTQVKVKVKV